MNLRQAAEMALDTLEYAVRCAAMFECERAAEILRAALVAAHEREECAKVCEKKGLELLRYWGDGQSGAACQECAAAIRARGES